MPTVIELPSSDKPSNKEDAERTRIIEERNALQLKAHKMRSAIDQLTDQLETTGQQVSYLRNRLLRIESSNLLLLDGIKSAVVNTTPPEDEELSDWQEDRYIRIRKHLQQLIKQAEATLVSTGQEDALSSELNDHTCNSLLVRDADDRPGQEKIAHEFNALMKVVDNDGDTVCALCHVKSKRQEPKNFLVKLSSKLGIPHEIVMAICKTMPYLARHAFSAFTILTALIPAVRAILGRRRKKGSIPKPRVTTVNRTKTAIISEVVYFAIMFITYTREIFGSDGTLSSIISRGKELWHIITSDATKEIEDGGSHTKKRERILCSFGSLINKLYAFIETNERNEKNVKKVVSNTVKVETLVGKLTQASKSSSSPLMHMATMFIYAAGLVGAWEVSKRATTSI
ncbi:hypothetical protein K450DRAFT_242675 [Umbelopsis ramanniana AG]|uniref:Uncharacterized protein n=1 Tax=Umbelopsis ramanniana AG TaxID=1314678 RepID=A0AAD5EAH3_UMBRA|nr:uncharacterized protein K450DRAFT_242675 [Umbelopsis ramanniana AG]KAI8579320.1 hypothetical protein K450DRAFT_242675 [Umbelopsis ramanniana AG]